MNLETTNPYIGPRTFREEESNRFFGREREARELFSLVLSERLVLFYAQSGAGKSSLLNTNLIPNMKSKGFKVLPVGRVSGDVPLGLEVNNIYVFNLLRTLSPEKKDLALVNTQPLTDFFAELNDKPEVQDAEYEKIFLIIDQFEELFSTHNEEWEKREDFFKQLSLVLQDNPNLWVLLSMREDYIASLDPYTALLPGRLRMRYYMQQLEREAALDAIRGPVVSENFLRPYAGGVAEKLVDDLRMIHLTMPDGEITFHAGQFIEPLILQVICYNIWENLLSDGTQITAEDLQEVGDVNQFLRAYYAKRVATVAKDHEVSERKIRKWFTEKLISPTGIRTMILHEPSGLSGGLENAVIMALPDLVRQQQRGGAMFYELSHDRLVSLILEDNIEWAEQNSSSLQKQAALWNKQGQTVSWLLSREALIEVEKRLQEVPEELAEIEEKFLEASRKNLNEIELKKRIARERRIRFQYTFLISATLIAVYFAFYGFSQAREAKLETEKAVVQTKIADSQRLAALSLSKINQLDLAMLLGIEAYKKDDNPQTQNALFTVLQESADIRKFLSIDPTDTIQLIPDSETIAIIDENGVTLHDLSGNLLAGPYSGFASPIYSTAFSPDGTILAASSKDGSILLWNTETWAQIGEPLIAHTAWVNSLAFSSDGKLLASASDDQSIIIWDMSTKSPIGKPIPTTAFCFAEVVFSPQSNILAASKCEDSTIELWDISDPLVSKQISVFGSQNPDDIYYSIYSLAFTPDGKTLATGGLDGSIMLWDVSTLNNPKLVASIPLEDSYVPIYSIAFNMDGTILASGDEAGAINLWNISNPKKPSIIGNPLTEHTYVVNSLAFSADGKTFASASFDGQAILWGLAKRKIIKKLIASQEFVDPINTVSFDPSGKVLAVGSENGTVALWDMSDPATPLVIDELLIGHATAPDTVEFTNNGDMITLYKYRGGYDEFMIINTNDSTVIGKGLILYDSAEERYLTYSPLSEPSDSQQTNFFNRNIGKTVTLPISNENSSFSSAGNVIVVLTYQDDGSSEITIWNATTAKMIGTPLGGNFLGLSRDGKFLVYSKNEDLEQVSILNINTFLEESIPVKGSSFDFELSQKILAYTVLNEQDESVIYLWDFMENKFINEPIVGSFVELSSNEETILYQNNDADGKLGLYLYNIATGSLINNEPIYANTYNYYPTFSPDGAILSYQTYDDVTGLYSFNFLDASTGQRISEPIQGEYLAQTIYQGNLLAYQISDNYSGEQKIILFDLAALQQIGDILRGEIKFLTPDGEVLIYQNEFGLLQEYDLINHFTNLIDFQGEFVGITSDSNILLVRNADTLQVIDWKRGEIPGQPILTKTDDEESEIAVISPDGSALAVFSQGEINLYDVNNNNQQIGKSFNQHKAPLSLNGNYLSFSPSESILAVGDFSTYTTTLWDVKTGNQIGEEIPGDYPRFSPNGTILAVGNSSTSTITLWDVKTGEPIREEIPGNYPRFSPDGTILAVGNYSTYSTTLWNVKTREPIGKEISGDYPVFSADGSMLAVGGYSTSTTILWDVTTRKPIWEEIPGDYPQFSPDGSMLAVGNYSTSTTILWDVKTGKPIGNEIIGNDPIFSMDGSILAVGDSSTYTTTLWDVKTRKPIGNEITGDYPEFNFDGTILAVGNYADYTTTLWTWDEEKKIFTPFLSEKKGEVSALKFSPDGEILASIGADGVILTSTITQQLLNAPFNGTDAVFSPTSNLVAIPNVNTTKLVEVSTGTESTVSGSDPLFSPDGSILSTQNYNDNTIAFFDVNNDFSLIQEEGTGNKVVFSPDGQMIAVLFYNPSTENRSQSSDEEDEKTAITPTSTSESKKNSGIYLYSLSDEALVLIQIIDIGECVEGECNGYSAVFSPDSKTLAYSDAKQIYFWDIENQVQKAESIDILRDPTDIYYGVTKFIYTQDNQFLISVSDYYDYAEAKIWDLETYTMLGEPIQGLIDIESYDLNHNMFLINTTRGSFLWKFDPDNWIEQLCSKVSRNFTRDEWKQYFPEEEYRATCSNLPLELEEVVP